MKTRRKKTNMTTRPTTKKTNMTTRPTTTTAARRARGLSAVLLFLTLGATAAEQPSYGATVAPFKTAPTLDGRLSPGEWDGALRLPAVMNYENAFVTPHGCNVFFGFTREHLYFAVVSELPPDGTLVANQTRIGANPQQLVFDDGIEIYIDPNRANRAAGKGSRSYFYYHGNSVGSYATIEFGSEGAPDPGWASRIEVANDIRKEEGVWIQEARFPLAALGLQPGDVIGRDVGILVARNIKRTGVWTQAVWFPHKGAFVGVDNYPLIRLTEDAPTVSLDSFGGLDLHKGPIQLQARIFNPGPAREAKVRLRIESTDMPGLTDEKLLPLPAGAFTHYTYKVGEGRLHEEAKHTLDLKIDSPDGAERYLNYRTHWTKAPETRWPEVPVGPQPARAVSLAYYPSLNRLFLTAAPHWLELKDCRRAHYRITTSRGRMVVEDDLAWEDAAGQKKELTLPELLDDTYTVEVKFDGWEEPIRKTFVRKHFPWEGNRIGVTDRVLPPFEPIRIEGSTANVVLRSHRFDGLGFWESLQVAGNVSAGGPRELLAAPMRLVADGKRVLKGEGAFTRQADHEVVYEGRAEHPAVIVETRNTLDMDGCMKVELTLLPGTKNEELRTLSLDIPLVDALVKLFHVSSTSLRYNPAGRIPSGEGHFWDTRDYPDGTFYGNFLPYIWLGAEERGLAFFADNDKGWELNVDAKDDAKSTPAVELIRQDGVLTMRINLVQKPVTLTEPRTIVFGLMASPGKPMPKNWRTSPMTWMGSQYWGSDRGFAARHPRHGDLSPLDMMQAARLGQPFDLNAFIETWTARNWGEGQPQVEKSKEQMQQLLRVSWNIATSSRNKPFTVYFEEFHSVDHAHEATKVFGSEWSGVPGSGIKPIAPSYRDFAVWWGAEFVRRGLGLYFDNSFPNTAYDPLISSAYRLPNGQVQPSAGIWARREYLRRIWTVHEQWGDKRMPPLMMIHMTNTHILPYMVWNHSNLDLEWFYADTPAQQSYAPDLLRAQSIGRQTGNIPAALARGQSMDKRPNRREMGAIFEIRMTNDYQPPKYLLEFGYGQDDCDVFNYWDDSYPVRFSDPQVKSILLRRGGKARLLLATWNGEPAKVTLTADAKTLGFVPVKATDVRTEAPMALVDGTVSFDLEGYGTKLIDLD